MGWKVGFGRCVRTEIKVKQARGGINWVAAREHIQFVNSRILKFLLRGY